MIESIAEAVKMGIIANLAHLMLGQYLGAVCVLGAGLLAWKLTQMHRSESSTFSWESVPGVVAAVVDLVVLFLGVYLILSGFNPIEN